MRRAVVLLVTSLLFATLVTAPLAKANPACDQIFANRYTGDGVTTVDIEGVRTLVLLPNDYESGLRRYPVVYLLPGGISPPDDYLIYTDLRVLAAGQAADQQAIVVLPEWMSHGIFIDWRNGAFKGEQFFIETLIPAIDSRFQTIPDGRHRALGAYSYTAFGASQLVAHNPDAFAAFASLSGGIDPDETDPVTIAFILAGGLVPPVCTDTPLSADPFGMFGDPITDAVWWHDGSISELAPNLRGMRVDVFAQSGVPCDARDVVELASDHPPFGFFEPFVERKASAFDAALTRAGVDHAFVSRPCGVHTYRYIEQDIHEWWAPLFDAFEVPRPNSFDFRRATPQFSVWQWTFTADPRRAAEFLDVKNASGSGVTLTGSGVETVTSAVYFTPGQIVSLSSAVEQGVTADSDGRITFHVDLGPAHTQQQYTIAARALEALGGYWITRSVTFETVS